MRISKMKLTLLLILALTLVFSVGCSKKEEMKKEKAETASAVPPKAKKIKKELTAHGHTRIDNYYWLNERKNPEVIEYLKAENKYTEEMMKDTKGLQETLFKEIVARIKQDDTSVPYKSNGYYYYSKYEKGKEYPIYCRKKGNMEAAEEILMDVNKMAKGKNFYQVSGLRVSPDNKLMAFGVDEIGRRKYTIFIKDLTTGKLLKDTVTNTTGSSVWANDNKTIFYTTKDKTLRSAKIHKHVLGTPLEKDTVVYHEKDTTYSAFVFKTKSKKYIMVGSFSTLSSEYSYIDADKPESEFKVVLKREPNHLYSVDQYKGDFYIRTNKNAQNFKLVKAPINAPEEKNWKEVLPHNKDILISGMDIFKDYLVVSERKKGLSQIHIIKWDGSADYYMAFDEAAYSCWTSTNLDFDTQTLRYGYTSMTTPYSVFDYDMKTKKSKLLKQTEVLGGFNKDNYVSERIMAVAKDGTEVPVSLVYKKGLKHDGNNPLLLYGYGSYGASMDPGFSSSRLSLLDRGFIWAIAHIRGGQEMGRYWYEDGKLLKKINTFTDFIDCGEYLIKKKYTSKDKLFAYGGSAGGLLMGAVMNMRPDLFKGIISAVPFVDVVTTMLDDSIPLTTGEYDEWGNPNKKEYYDYMLSYSPYDNVKAAAYPAMLVTTGLHDSQVQYFEPAKWVAKLREMKTDNNILLMKTDMEAGHGGTTGRFKYHRETALKYAFLLKLLK